MELNIQISFDIHTLLSTTRFQNFVIKIVRTILIFLIHLNNCETDVGYKLSLCHDQHKLFYDNPKIFNNVPCIRGTHKRNMITSSLNVAILQIVDSLKPLATWELNYKLLA